MSRYISDKLRLFVANRSGFRCEYCRRMESDSFIKFQIEHIISLKHGGKTVLNNLAYSCPICNSFKGSDIATYVNNEDELVRLFNPRKDEWFQHYSVENGLLIGKTDIALATIKILELNQVNRVLERLDLIEVGLYP